MGLVMNLLDPIVLARIQFAFTVSFHIIFPAFSIGLASYLAVLNGLGLWTGRSVFDDLFNYWKKIFAVAFGMGVVSGIVMSYQFGTNWSVFSDKVGPVLGPLMGYEVLSAFFLEAGFLGVMLFGRERVGPKLHFLATLMVAFGTFFSAFWILSVNSWMQTPAGYSINANGQFIAVNWWAVIFNPSFPYRLVHMVLAAYLTTAFVVGGVGAIHLLRDRTNPAVRIMFSMAMWMAATRLTNSQLSLVGRISPSTKLDSMLSSSWEVTSSSETTSTFPPLRRPNMTTRSSWETHDRSLGYTRSSRS
jgi:cytochrome d ubiquinol oxidase subunit I